MKDIHRSICPTCNKIHITPPSFSFASPIHYHADNPHKLDQKLDGDLCFVQNNFFIRVILEIPILEMCQPFLWSVWISQSEEDFKHYLKHFDDSLIGHKTFGWFANIFPHYGNTLNVHATAIFQDKGQRPKLHLEQSDHELSQDFHHGVSIKKAEEIVKIASNPIWTRTHKLVFDTRIAVET